MDDIQYRFTNDPIKTFTESSDPYEDFYSRRVTISIDTPNIDSNSQQIYPQQETIFRDVEYFLQRGSTCSIFSIINAANSLGNRIVHPNLSKLISKIYKSDGSNLFEILEQFKSYNIDLTQLGLDIKIKDFPSDPIIQLMSEKNKSQFADERQKDSNIIRKKYLDSIRGFNKDISELILSSISTSSVLYFSTSSNDLMNNTQMIEDKQKSHVMVAVGKRSNVDGTVSIQVINSHGASYWVSLDLFLQQVDKKCPLGVISLL